MRFLSAGALWWLALGAIIIFFYLLKLKRNRRVVPSVFLWQRALEEMEANAPFRRLRRSLLLLLQLLALVALAFALARPLVTTRSLASGSTVIVIDSTASMSTRDEDGRSRLDRARELAREMVASLSGERAAVIESSSRVTVRSPLTSDRAALNSAIENVTETDAAGTLADALLLAEQIAKTERDTSVVVLGDGGGANFDSNQKDGIGTRAAPLRFVRIGQRSENIGIVAMNSRPAEGGKRAELFASIANFTDSNARCDLELRLDGKLIDARTIDAAASEQTGVIFDSLPQSGGLAELKLAADDDLAADNLAYAFIQDARRLRVGVAGENPFLLQALAVNSDFDARRINSGADADQFDCIVSEGQTAQTFVETSRPLLVINPPDLGGLWQTTGGRERPEISARDAAHPVNNFLSYTDLHIESAAKRDVAPWLRPIAGSADGGLIWAGDDGRRRVVLVGFDLAKSDLPLKVEFPILLANSVAWLAGRDQMTSERVARAGQPVTINAAIDASTNQASSTVSVTGPDGRESELPTEDGGAIFADTMRVGAYKVEGAQGFAVTLLSETESDNAPRDSIQTRAGEVTGQQESFSSEREAWRWLVLAALALLAFEWWVYHRRVAA